MFSPEMLSQAQNMMKNMTPEQLAQMQRMAGNMSPDMLKQMNSMTGASLSEEDFRRAQDQMKSMNPDDLKRGVEQASQQAKGRESYLLGGASALKNEGNALIKSQKYAEAKEKYLLGLSNLASLKEVNSAEKVALEQSFKLNLALCHLKLKELDKVVAVCSEVLEKDGKHPKALFRRAMALREMGDRKCAKDLDLAHSVSPHDEAVTREWQSLKEELGEEKFNEALKETVEKVEKVDKVVEEDGKIEEDVEEIPASSSQCSQAPTSAPPSFPSGPMPPIDPSKLPPGAFEQASSMLSGMSDEQLDTILSMSGGGLPGGDKEQMKSMLRNPEMLKMAQSMMKNMPPEQMEKMAKSMGGQGGGAGQGGPSGEQAPQDLLQDPSMMSSVAEMVNSMDDEAVEKMISSQVGASPDAPPPISGRTAKRFLWFAMKVMYFLLLIKNFFRALLQRRFVLLSLVIVFTFWLFSAQIKALVFGKEVEEGRGEFLVVEEL